MKVISRTRNDLVLWFLLFCCTIAVSAFCVIGDYRFDSPVSLGLLFGLALIAECLPVEVVRQGLYVTLSMPYIACMAISSGVTTSILANVLLVTFACIYHLRTNRKKSKKADFAWNLGTSVLSSSVAGGALLLVPNYPSLGAWHAAYLSAMYCVVYGTVTFSLITIHDIRTFGRRFSDNIVANLKIGATGFILYGLIAASLAVVVMQNAYVAIVFSLIPLLALRMGLTLKAASYQHYYETITTLTLMLQRAHPYTHGHLLRVAAYAEEVALRLGFNHRHAHMVREASVMHDLGKIAVDEEILDKPGKLDEVERVHVRRHSELGAQILSQVAQFQAIVPWVRSHHERPDGSGYPDRMVDVEIPVESKIIAVADAYDAMTTWEPSGESRLYREPMTVEGALAELERCAGSQFDARVVEVFKEVVQGRDNNEH